VDHGDDKPYLSLADFVGPTKDHIGAFAVTAGLGVDELAARFQAEHDDYRAIMVKALADRLAEAFAAYLHEVARRGWYENEPKHTREELIGGDQGEDYARRKGMTTAEAERWLRPNLAYDEQ